MESTRILIVEDDPFEAEHLQLHLIQQGYQVLAIVDSGEDCLEWIRKNKVDLIIIDIMLSGEMDGVELAQMVHRFYRIPFIFLTAHDSDDFIARAELTQPIAYLLKPYRVKEVNFLIRMGMTRWNLEQKLHQDKEKAEANLWRLATHDPLTHLPNRNLLTNQLEGAIRKAHRNGTKLALLIIDLDNFKDINDSFGHAVGDQVLQAVARHLEVHAREDDSIARLGGDDFTIIIEQPEDAQNIGIFSQKLIGSFNEPFKIGKHSFAINISIGISLYPDDGKTPDTLLRDADSAMNRAKAVGRNNFQFYTSDLTDRALERVKMESALRSASHDKQFDLYFQPQVSIETGKVVGAEALIRWQHPEKGMILPLEFIPTAEKTGQIDVIGNWVLKTACQKAAKWRQAGYRAIKIAINIADRQLSQHSITTKLKDILKQTGCDPSAIELEITESCLVDKPEHITKELQSLRDIGISIAIDDFGTGYSSLSYLKKFPINKLKIDQSFIKDIPEDSNDEAISRAIIAMGKSLDLEIIAEGVETQAQKEFLMKEGCNTGQGFLFSEALPEEDFLQYLLDH